MGLAAVGGDSSSPSGGWTTAKIAALIAAVVAVAAGVNNVTAASEFCLIEAKGVIDSVSIGDGTFGQPLGYAARIQTVALTHWQDLVRHQPSEGANPGSWQLAVTRSSLPGLEPGIWYARSCAYSAGGTCVDWETLAGPVAHAANPPGCLLVTSDTSTAQIREILKGTYLGKMPS